jgi:alkylated DNA nucleotide flippase Atl1
LEAGVAGFGRLPRQVSDALSSAHPQQAHA